MCIKNAVMIDVLERSAECCGKLKLQVIHNVRRCPHFYQQRVDKIIVGEFVHKSKAKI